MKPPAVIFNPCAGAADQIELLRQHLRQRFNAQVHQTRNAQDVVRVTHEAIGRGVRTIVAAGGDGTASEVVNAIMCSSEHNDVTLAILPLGTGNDLPRSLGIPLDATGALEVLLAAQTRRIDLFAVRYGRQQRYGINVAAGGFTGRMNEVMTDQLKQSWGPLAYLRGATKVLHDLTKYRTSIRYDGKPQSLVHAVNIIVANGRTAGGGTVVVPTADLTDGLLDVVIVHTGSLLDLTGVAARLLAGDYTNSDIVTHRRVKRVQIDARPGMWFNVDGELLTNEPITFSVVPRALRVVVGTGAPTPSPSPTHGGEESKTSSPT